MVVLIAGWACPAYWMESLAQAIIGHGREDYQLASIHQFGHDPASWRTGLAQWLRDLQPCQVVAWSMGAMAAMDVLQAEPDLETESWVLLAPTLRFCEGPDWPWGQPTAAVRALRRAVQTNPIEALVRFRQSCAQPHTLPPDVALSDARQMAAFSLPELTEALRHLERWDLRPVRSVPHRRVLVIHGHQDAIIPVEAGRQVAQQLGAALAVGDEMGHDMVVRCPELLAQTIRDCFDTRSHE